VFDINIVYVVNKHWKHKWPSWILLTNSPSRHIARSYLRQSNAKNGIYGRESIELGEIKVKEEQEREEEE